MKNYTKTLIGGIVAFILGTSCCWMSAIGIWLGGATFIGLIVEYVQDFQTQLYILSSLLVLISIYLYRKSIIRKQP